MFSHKGDRNGAFDLLRLALAIEVLIGHVPGIPAFVPPVVAVPVFVCLSGYLIPKSFETSRDWKHFAWKRILRVYPALLASLILVEWIVDVKAVWPTLVTYFTIGLVALPWSANGALWTLMLEELLYTSHVCARIFRVWGPQLAFAGIALCCVGWSILCVNDVTATHGHMNIFVVTPMCFFLGNLLYFYRGLFSRVSVWVLLGFFVYGYSLRVSGSLSIRLFPLHGLYPGVTWPISACIGAVCSVLLATRARVRIRIPDLSYGIYVYHVPVIFALGRVGYTGGLLLARTLLVVIPIAVVSWYCIEKPALRLKNYRRQPKAIAVPPYLVESDNEVALEIPTPLVSKEPVLVA